MKIVVSAICCLLMAFALQAQNPSPNAVVSAGTDTNSSLQVTWQLGSFPFILERTNIQSADGENDGVKAYQISLLPNPTSDYVELNFGVELSPTAQIYIVDVKGQRQLQQSGANLFQTTLDIQTLAQGTYYVKVEDEVHELPVIQFKKVNQ